MIEACTDNKYISIYNFPKRNQDQFKPNLREFSLSILQNTIKNYQLI